MATRSGIDPLLTARQAVVLPLHQRAIINMAEDTGFEPVVRLLSPTKS